MGQSEHNRFAEEQFGRRGGDAHHWGEQGLSAEQRGERFCVVDRGKTELLWGGQGCLGNRKTDRRVRQRDARSRGSHYCVP